MASNAVTPSGSLPVMYINTENEAPILSKEDYIKGSYYLDAMGIEGLKDFGSVTDQLPLQIRGRGNYTWVDFEKKPYRLKLDSKAALLGMKKSKHFALLAHADDDLGFMRNATGIELSRRLGLNWTPAAEPVEVVLNGDYIGLYFLTETIRVDEDRVDIVEQADNETDPDKITGGWLVEIDNYDSDPHVEIYEDGRARTVFTYKSPEVLSKEQETYLINQMEALDKAIYTSDKSSSEWEKLIDIDQLARYYIVQEILDDCESFHGSCYLYKDLGEDQKWNFGPVWDFGNSFHRGGKSKFIYQDPIFYQTWIGEIAKYPAFQEKVKEVWKEFAATESKGFYKWVTDEMDRMKEAAQTDAQRWPNYGNSDMEGRKRRFVELLMGSINWLGAQWGVIIPEPIPDPMPVIYFRGNFNGWSTSHPFTELPDGTHLLTGLTIKFDGRSQFKIASEFWDIVDFGATPDSVLELGKPYKLTVKGGDIDLPGSIENGTVRFSYADKTLLITDASSGVDKVGEEKSYTLSGQILSAAEYVEVYTPSGVRIWSGTGSVSLQPSVYIIRSADGSVHKLLVK